MKPLSFLIAILHHVDSFNRAARIRKEPVQATFNPRSGLVDLYWFTHDAGWALTGSQMPVPNAQGEDDDDAILFVDTHGKMN